MGFSVSLPELLTILGLILTASGLFGTILWNLWRKVTGNSSDLAAFKLEVAEKYVNGKQLHDMERKMLISEERLHSSMTNLTDRIDRMLDRMEK